MASERATERLPRHDPDIVSLLFGLLFLLVAGIYLISNVAGFEVSWHWAAPLGLIALGAIGLVASLRSR